MKKKIKKYDKCFYISLRSKNESIKKISDMVLHHLNDYCVLRKYDQIGKNEK